VTPNKTRNRFSSKVSIFFRTVWSYFLNFPTSPSREKPSVRHAQNPEATLRIQSRYANSPPGLVCPSATVSTRPRPSQINPAPFGETIVLTQCVIRMSSVHGSPSPRLRSLAAVSVGLASAAAAFGFWRSRRFHAVAVPSDAPTETRP